MYGMIHEALIDIQSIMASYPLYIYIYTDDGLRRLFQPGLENKDIGETSRGSCTQEEGEQGTLCGVRGL